MTLDPNTPVPEKTGSSLQSQGYALLRHGVTALGTAFTIFGGLGLLSQDDVAKLMMALHDASGAVQTLVTSVMTIAVIVGPVIVGISGKFAASAASLPGQLKSITNNKDVHIPPGSKIIVPPAVAAAVPSPKVVAPAVPPGTTFYTGV